MINKHCSYGDTDVEKKCMDTEGWGGTNWEIRIDIYALLCIKWDSLVADSKASAHNAGDPGSIPGLGRSPGEGNGYPLQCSGLENSMDWVCKESDMTNFYFLSAFAKIKSCAAAASDSQPL